MNSSDVQPIGGKWAVGAGIAYDGQPALFRMNVDLQELGQSSPFDEASLVVISFTDTDERGMPTAATSEQLDALGERVVAHLRKQGTGVLTGFLTIPNVGRAFCMYLESTEDMTWFGKLLAPYQGRAVDALTGADPQWSEYHKQVAAARSGQADIAVISQLRAAGIHLSGDQYQEHYLVFTDEYSAQRAAGVLPSDVFDLVQHNRATEGHWTVVVGLRDSVDLFSLAKWRQQFRALANDFGGSYDGWGVPTESGS